MKWQTMDSAPKSKSEEWQSCTGPEILATDGYDVRVIWWTNQYPYNDGVWCEGVITTDYIDELKTYDPIGWISLDELPELPKT